MSISFLQQIRKNAETTPLIRCKVSKDLHWGGKMLLLQCGIVNATPKIWLLVCY